MSESTQLWTDKRWYLSYEILYFEYDDPAFSRQQDLLVWENLILIEAADSEEAYQKAVQHGLDSEGEVKMNGRKGFCKFKGLKDLIKIYDDLEDGAEIEWREYKIDREDIETLIKSKQELHTFQPLPAEEN